MDILSLEQAAYVLPAVNRQRLEVLLPHFNAACTEAEINTSQRCACFIAQLAHESGEFRYFEELGKDAGAQYEGRKDLGNLQPGDGKRYKGRGPIQLTGRANYRAAGVALGLDLEANPAIVATPAVGFRVAGWFWKSKGLNALADANLFSVITKKINGGWNGEAQREAYYARARKAFGLP
jgi:putative chitinase